MENSSNYKILQMGEPHNCVQCTLFVSLCPGMSANHEAYYNSNLLYSYLGIGTSLPYVFDGNSLVDVYFSLMGLKGKLCGDWGTKSLSPKNSMSFFSPNNCGLFMAFDGGLQGLEKLTLYQSHRTENLEVRCQKTIYIW